jgi:hypothetical protein
MRVLPSRVKVPWRPNATLVPSGLASLLFLAVACAKPPAVAPGGDHLAGRWVMVNTAVGYHLSNGSVESIMYPPQAPAPSKYRVAADSIVLAHADRVARHGFVLRGDTLRLSWSATATDVLIRMPGSPANGLAGSWRGRAMNTTTILTFRSDSAMVMEVAVPFPARRGDTLVFRAESGRDFRTVLYFANGRLNGRNLDDRQVRTVAFVRRPWGCFGVKALDQGAAECR